MNRFLLWVAFGIAICLLLYSAVMLFFVPETPADPAGKKRNNEAFPETDFEEKPGPGKPPVQ
jgi:hypothetical protein